jgi:hypothetical protein
MLPTRSHARHQTCSVVPSFDDPHSHRHGRQGPVGRSEASSRPAWMATRQPTGLEDEDGRGVRMVSVHEALTEFRASVAGTESPVEDLLAERRDEAAREAAGQWVCFSTPPPSSPTCGTNLAPIGSSPSSRLTTRSRARWQIGRRSPPRYWVEGVLGRLLAPC